MENQWARGLPMFAFSPLANRQLMCDQWMRTPANLNIFVYGSFSMPTSSSHSFDVLQNIGSLYWSNSANIKLIKRRILSVRRLIALFGKLPDERVSLNKFRRAFHRILCETVGLSARLRHGVHTAPVFHSQSEIFLAMGIKSNGCAGKKSIVNRFTI